MRRLGKVMVLALVLLLVGCGTVATPQPDSARAVPTTVPVAVTPEPTSTRLGAYPTTATAAPAGQTESLEPTPTAALAASELPDLVRITIVYDNTAVQPGLGAEWGFAAWVEVADKQILFDTGPDGPTLLSNLAQLGLDPEEIDVVVLSHEHGDHVGGLASLLGAGIQPPVYVPRGFPESLKASVRARTELVEMLDPVEILPGLYSTGQLGGGPAEQALVMRSSAGLVVLTGCAHPGILRIIRQAQALVEDELALVLGGFHLVDSHPETVAGIVSTFRELGVKQVAPTHCTGETAIREFAEEYGPDCLEGGAGQVFSIGQEETPTSALPAPSATAPEGVTVSNVGAILDSLKGLALEEFFEESYKQLLLRHPEQLTAMGLAKQWGLRNDQLNDLSDAYRRETQQLEAGILDLLQIYDREALPVEDQLSYDVYEWYLTNRVRGHAFLYHDYPLNHFLGSYHFELETLLTELHPLETLQDVEDFIVRLSQVDRQVDQLMEGLALREELGVIPPTFIIDLTRQALVRTLGMRSPDPAAIQAEEIAVYGRFSQELETIQGLSAEQKEMFRATALKEMGESFVPAYLSLVDYLEYLRPLATDEAGAWKLPDGDAYYAAMLCQETSTNLTPAEVHEMGLVEVDRIQSEMRQVFGELGYPPEASFPESMDRAIREGGFLTISSQQGKDQYISEFEALIREAEEAADEVFDLRPRGKVVVMGGEAGGYYVPGTPDGSRPGAFHISLLGNWRPKYSMPTVAYHEAVPGHHFQIALAQEMDLPLFRTDVAFNGYIEGWALYAERLAWELGLYDDDPYGNLGRLQYELLRAVRLVTDTGIHAMHWSREEARAFMDEAMGGAPGQFSHEVDRYVVLPAQATSYKIGMMKLLELRQRARQQLGDRFDLKEFHNAVLGSGSLPLGLLDRLVQDYINATLAESE